MSRWFISSSLRNRSSAEAAGAAGGVPPDGTVGIGAGRGASSAAAEPARKVSTTRTADRAQPRARIRQRFIGAHPPLDWSFGPTGSAREAYVLSALPAEAVERSG